MSNDDIDLSDEVEESLQQFSFRARKYQSAFWSVMGLTGLGLILMYVGAQLYMTGLIQVGICVQAGGLLLGFYLARRGGQW